MMARSAIRPSLYFVLLVMAGASPVAADDWPHWRGPHRDGIAGPPGDLARQTLGPVPAAQGEFGFGGIDQQQIAATLLFSQNVGQLMAFQVHLDGLVEASRQAQPAGEVDVGQQQRVRVGQCGALRPRPMQLIETAGRRTSCPNRVTTTTSSVSKTPTAATEGPLRALVLMSARPLPPRDCERGLPVSGCTRYSSTRVRLP